MQFKIMDTLLFILDSRLFELILSQTILEVTRLVVGTGCGFDSHFSSAILYARPPDFGGKWRLEVS